MPATINISMHKAKGFTLIELVVVVVLLAIIGTFSFRFIGLGAQVYTDTAAREQLVSQSRFALERLARELRNALPRSARVYNSGRCIQYAPIITSGEYLSIPTTTNPGDNITAIAPLERRTQPITSRHLAIYITQPSALYDGSAQRYLITDRAVDTIEHTITYTLDGSNMTVDNTGPSRRFFEISPPVSWCYNPVNGELRRYQSVDFTEIPPAPSVVAGGALMAKQLNNNNISPAVPLFEVDNVTLSQNNLVLIDFSFQRDNADEPLNLLYEVHIPNVP